MKPRGSRFETIYGLSKVHKQLVDNCLPFRPITSAIKTPTYNLNRFLVPLLEPITANIYAVKNSFESAKEIADQDLGTLTASLDVESLFTDIPLEGTISVLSDSFFSYDAKVNNINRIDFEKLSRAALQNSFFNFQRKIYTQIDGVASGSPLTPTLAKTVLYFHEQFVSMFCSNVSINSNLHSTEDMSMTYWFYFVHLIILRNSKTI